MQNFVKIAEGIEVGAALAELAGQPDYLWLTLNPDASRYISLLGAGGERRLETELPETWRLIDAVRSILAAEHGDNGALSHARVGLMPRARACRRIMTASTASPSAATSSRSSPPPASL